MSLVTTEHRGDVAVLTIDNPPVNAGNNAQRSALLEAIDTVARRPVLTGIVLTTAGRHFYAGSDLREFDGPLGTPHLPAVLEALDRLDVPIVAAIRGLALGGGLEVALACDVRLGDPTAVVGFPEVGFGLVPGAGGTVRSARLLGADAAVDLVTSARRVAAPEAVRLGLLDELVEADELVDRAVAMLASGVTKRRLVDIAPVAAGVDSLVDRLPRRHRPHVAVAARLVTDGMTRPAAEALVVERAAFDELRVSTESKSLRYLFFARQAASRDLRPVVRVGGSVRRVGVIGAGTMGAGLARMFAANGFDTVVVDPDQTALDRLDVPALTVSQSVDACADRDLVIEAVYEDMAVKRELLAKLEAVVADDAVLVTNTSYLDLDEMARSLSRPQRFGGLHFFNPPEKNTLVEVIPGAATDDRTRSVLGDITARLGKVGVLSGVGDGFVGNRVYANYRSQAEFLVEDGAGPAEVDRAMQDFGMAIGPFAVADMSGLDIAWARRRRLAADRDPEARYVTIADRLCEQGRFGKKAGAGWYAYPDGGGVEDPSVLELIDRCRTEAGITPRTVDADEITSRILAAMVAGAATVVAAGVAQRASDVDVALTEGFAFPRHLGGPVKAFSRLPADVQLSSLAAVYASDPAGFAELAAAARGTMPADIQKILTEVVQ